MLVLFCSASKGTLSQNSRKIYSYRFCETRFFSPQFFVICRRFPRVLNTWGLRCHAFVPSEAAIVRAAGRFVSVSRVEHLSRHPSCRASVLTDCFLHESSCENSLAVHWSHFGCTASQHIAVTGCKSFSQISNL